MKFGIGAILLVLGVISAAIDRGEAADAGSNVPPSSRWEIGLDGRVGVPAGYLKVGEFNVPGTRLRLRDDLDIDLSEALEFGVRYHLTPRDALRATFLYYFLDGSTTTSRPVTYNGQTFAPGRLHTNADFSRATVGYERGLFPLSNGGSLTGGAALTYVYLNAKVNGNAEDFYLQELPVPLLTVRLDTPLRGRFGLTASLEGGGLPRVDSLRKEGGTVFLEQQHADAGLALTYALRPALWLHAGYRFTYFFQREKSHEDENAFQLIDNAFRLGLTVRF